MRGDHKIMETRICLISYVSQQFLDILSLGSILHVLVSKYCLGIQNHDNNASKSLIYKTLVSKRFYVRPKGSRDIAMSLASVVRTSVRKHFRVFSVT